MDELAPNLFSLWCSSDSYFQDLAVFSLGSLHPGGLEASRDLFAARNWSGCHVLDVGCGNGTTMRFLDAMGAITVGVEPSPFMREAARQQGTKKERIIPNNVESLQLGRKRFDVIVLEGVIGFIEDPVPCVERLLGHLSINGDLFICDWMPHTRTAVQEFGFHVFGAFDPEEVAKEFCRKGLNTRLVKKPTVARAFTLDVEEGIRRAILFFPSARKEEIRSVVERKIEAMRNVLSSQIDTERYLLKISNRA